MKTLALLMALAIAPTTAVAHAASGDLLKLLHLLDYIAADYAEAVEDGAVVDEHEFEEMQEFAEDAGRLARALPANAARADIVGGTARLDAAIAAKAAPDRVAESARALRARIIAAYSVRTEPPAEPDAALGARLYAQACASCHGANGRGDGAAAAMLKPAPTDFNDADRMAGRTLFGLYSTITLGVEGTSMAPFAHLDDDARWALARHVQSFLRPTDKD